MTLMRWDPFRDLVNLQNRISQMLSETQPWDAESSLGSWTPAVDIFERGDDLVIRAELPGLSAEGIDVRVENNTLTLSGERKQDEELRQGKVYRRERTYGAFSRRFNLPTTVDATRIGATQKNGILEVVLPKAETVKPRKVQIRAD
jgi:HSP20 family protein